ncbi:peptidoglycan binding domain-containing protein [Streptomyces sp. NPDC051555]|uniref:peptidoglycan binding domain-containing protein n=1 Tax=Streptomyces sp. NPDC051555 TaxID=3365657 RepID=UPI0037BCEE24
MTSKPSTPAADSDGPKTETTLTTRIRINIPGSRPIPPVVVRKPVGAGAGEPEQRPQAPAAPAAPAGPSAGSGAPFGRAAGAPAPSPQGPPPAPAAPESGAEPPSNWFAPRKAGPGDAPEPGQGPAAGQGPGPAQGPGQGRPGLPARPGPVARTSGPGAGFPPGAPGAQAPAGYGAQYPAGPPAPPVDGFGGGYQGGAPGGVPAPPPAPGYGTGPAAAPAGPTSGPVHGTGPVGGPPRLDDDTANFAAPRWPGPELNGTGGAATSAFPVADPPPPAGFTPPPPAPAAADPQGKNGKKGKKGKAAARPAGSAAPAASAKKAKKGRSKVVLLGGALFAVVGIAYGAGLLLNHSDVPKGTTVFGVDITGTRDEAVAKLQSTFGPRSNAPVKLTVGGKQVELKPDKAGLTLDAQTTVRNAAGSDYNPVTVIGSLLGQKRVAEPVMPVDEEKLQVALEELAGTAGSASEGTIKFEPNKVVAVPGKEGTSLDVDASITKVVAAYRDQVGTGKAAPVELPTAKRAPVVNQAELDRAMKEFAEPAMSGNVTVKAGDKSVPYGPARSLPKILSMTVIDGKLVDKYDLEAIKELTGTQFDGVLIARGNGDKTAVTPQDIVGALRKGLRGKTAAERTVTIDTNPS